MFWLRNKKIKCLLPTLNSWHEHEISAAHNNKNDEKSRLFLALKLSDVVFIMLINVIGGILTFMSMINFMLRLSLKKFYDLWA